MVKLLYYVNIKFYICHCAPAASTAINFDFLDNLVSSVPSQYTSNTSLNQSGSRSSLSSNWTQKKHVPRIPRVRKSTQSMSRKVSTLKVVSPASSQDSHVIDTVADAQVSPRKPSQKLLDPRKLLEALTPIREMTGEDDEPHTDMEDKKLSQMSTSAAKEVSHSRDNAGKIEVSEFMQYHSKRIKWEMLHK